MFELISRSPSRYYLAYGSNLDMERMGKRCPYAVVVGPRYYYKKQFQLPVWNLNGNRMKKAKPCIAYVMHEDRRLGCPDAEYFELLRGGYSDWEFPLDTLKRGLAASIGRAEAIRYLKKQQMM